MPILQKGKQKRCQVSCTRSEGLRMAKLRFEFWFPVSEPLFSMMPTSSCGKFSFMSCCLDALVLLESLLPFSFLFNLPSVNEELVCSDILDMVYWECKRAEYQAWVCCGLTVSILVVRILLPKQLSLCVSWFSRCLPACLRMDSMRWTKWQGYTRHGSCFRGSHTDCADVK